MKRMLTLAALLAVSSQAMAHPTNIPYDTRGDCEAAYAKFSKFDRERLADLGFTPGEAQATFRDLFLCVYDPNSRKWYITLVGEF